MTHDVLTIFDETDELYEAAADQIAEVIRSAEPGQPVRVALCGGSTPRPVFRRLSSIPDMDWNRIRVYWGDERTVGPDHEDSNYRMTHETLLAHIPIRDDFVHRMRGEIDPEQAAKEYELLLQETFCLEEEGEIPRFDLMLLGMGADGHTASLFPDTPALEETERLVVANPVPQQNTVRITLTLPVLNASRNVSFLVSGEDKAEALSEVFSDGDISDKPPAALVQPWDGTLRWLVDRPAARLLT